MVIGKRFDRIDRVVVVGCCVAIGWITKFGFVEGEIHAGESKSAGFSLTTVRALSSNNQPEKICADRSRLHHKALAQIPVLKRRIRWGNPTDSPAVAFWERGYSYGSGGFESYRIAGSSAYQATCLQKKS